MPDQRERLQVLFNRRSTVSLFSNFGEVRLGRDYTPTFWNLTIFDAFGTNGVGSFAEHGSDPSSACRHAVRANNTIGYFLPGNLGGFYGQAMVGAGEGNVEQSGTLHGGQVGFARSVRLAGLCERSPC